MFVAVSLAEGEELGSNGLLICIDRSSHAEDAPIQLLEITEKFVEQRVTSGLFWPPCWVIDNFAYASRHDDRDATALQRQCGSLDHGGEPTNHHVDDAVANRLESLSSHENWSL